MLCAPTQLNPPGPRLAPLDGVHAMTDVTGFGLLGHLLEVCKGSGVPASLSWDSVPLLPAAMAMVRAGHVTGADERWSARDLPPGRDGRRARHFPVGRLRSG